MDIVYSDAERRNYAEIRKRILSDPAFWVSQLGYLAVVGFRCVASWAIATVVSHYFLMVWAVSFSGGVLSQGVSQWMLWDVYSGPLFGLSAAAGLILALIYQLSKRLPGLSGLRTVYGDCLHREIRG